MATKLDIVNAMLVVVGERTQSTVTSGHPSVLQALSVFDSENEELQAKGWWFNTDTDITLVQMSDGRVPIPADCIEFRVTAKVLQYSADKRRFVRRGNYVYDSVKHTFYIGESIRADLVRTMSVEDMPSAASTYLKHRCAQTMYTNDDGDQVKMQRLEERTARAWQQLQAAHLKATAVNRLDTPAAQRLRYRMADSGYGASPMPGKPTY